MVTKRIRSEYMKRFKDPKWDSYARCYENLLKYRLSRRLLEQAHNPWFWGECGSETDSSGTSTPLGRNKVEPQRSRDVKAAPDVTPEPAAEHQERDAQTRGAEQNHPIVELEKRRESTPVLNAESDTHTQNKAKPKRLSSHKSSRSKGKPHATKDAPKDATQDATKDPDKENRHPFALYGAGEKQTDMASRKTHNVGPAASTSEIHESALRAKTRREAEKQIRRVDKQRAKSVDLEKSGIKIVPDYNPWMTEYMRCFSARAR